MNKKSRHDAIKQIISQNNIENQTVLLEYLERAGGSATQATISRDIRELNIIKSPDLDGKSYYRILNSSTNKKSIRSDEERLANFLYETATDITQVEFVNVINTIPGNGQAVAILIDKVRITFSEIVACLAGDDTVLVISKTKEDAVIVHDYLSKYIN